MTTRKDIQEMVDAKDVEGLVALHSEAMKTIEVIWRKVAKANADTPFEGKALSMHFRAKAFHCDADVLANEMANVPMPRSGER